MNIKDKFCLMDIRNKAPYNLASMENVINDLRRCFLVVDTTPEVFCFKDYDALNDITCISYVGEKDAKAKLSKIIAGVRMSGNTGKNINCWNIYLENTVLFTVKGLKFFSQDPDVFSFFRGYDYELVEEVDMEKIQPFLTHVHDIICDGNDDLYNYLLNWYSSILQRPSFKTETALVVLGKQGSGKNKFFTDVLCKLMVPYVNENLTNMDDIIGKFNAALENRKLIICNELQSIDVNKFLNSDALKSVITDKQMNINQKNQPVRIQENVVNLILVSNNMAPIKIEHGDRRYVVFRTSDAKCKDFEYFENLAETFDEEFYQHLFTFFFSRDITKVNLRKIPHTQAKEDIVEASKNSVELFIDDNWRFIEKKTGPALYDAYSSYCNRFGYQPMANRTFVTHLKTFTGETTFTRIEGKKVRVYNLLPQVVEQYMKRDKEILDAEDEQAELLRELNE